MIEIPAAIAAVIQLAVQYAPALGALFDAKPYVDKIIDITNGGNVTQEQLDEMLNDLRANSEAIQSVKTDG